MLRYLALPLATTLLWACPHLLADERPADQERRIADLIAQLDGDTYAGREAAQEELRKLGGPALPALEEAAASPSPEVRNRAERLLKQIRRDVFVNQMEAFVEGSKAFLEGQSEAKAVRPPGWEPYLRIVGGDSKPARKFYAEMLLSERELFFAMLEAKAAADSNSEYAREARNEYREFAEARWRPFGQGLRAEANRTFRQRLAKNEPYTLSPVEEARLMAFVFAQTQFPPEWTADQAEVLASGLLAGFALGQQTSPAGRPALYHRLKQEGARAELIRRLIGAWLLSQVGHGGEAAALGVAMQLHLKGASVAAAERILTRMGDGDNERPELNSTFLAIHALMLWGRENRQVKLIEPYLSDNRQRRLGGYKGTPPRKSIIMREWAMMGLLRMTGQKAEDFGKPTSMTTYCAAARWVGIQIYKPDAWGEALEAWKAWSKKNLGEAEDRDDPAEAAEKPPTD